MPFAMEAEQWQIPKLKKLPRSQQWQLLRMSSLVLRLSPMNPKPIAKKTTNSISESPICGCIYPTLSEMGS
jgi:hypothetical protein